MIKTSLCGEYKYLLLTNKQKKKTPHNKISQQQTHSFTLQTFVSLVALILRLRHCSQAYNSHISNKMQLMPSSNKNKKVRRDFEPKSMDRFGSSGMVGWYLLLWCWKSDQSRRYSLQPQQQTFRGTLMQQQLQQELQQQQQQ